MEVRIGKSHHARKALFQKGIQQGYLTVQEIEAALPEGSMTPSERWLLYYSLRAANVEIHGEGQPERPPEQAPDGPPEAGLGEGALR